MALPTVYYYNSGKFPISFKGDDTNHYYIPPRTYAYIPVGPGVGYVVPKALLSYNLPGWWKHKYFPKAYPWWPSYDPWPNLRV